MQESTIHFAIIKKTYKIPITDTHILNLFRCCTYFKISYENHDTCIQFFFNLKSSGREMEIKIEVQREREGQVRKIDGTKVMNKEYFPYQMRK